MQKLVLCSFIFLTVSCHERPSNNFVDLTTPRVIDDYSKLIWSDEFNGKVLNKKKWDIEETPDLRNVGGNHELQYYVDSPQNLFIDNHQNNSVLFIKPINVFNEYVTSSKITTLDKFHFTYGKIQARIKAPSGAGVWPAFWAIGVNNRLSGMFWPLAGEIDIMEIWGDDKNEEFSTSELYGTIHYGDKWPNNQFSGPTTRKINGKVIPDFGSDYHIYEVNWTADTISWSVDGFKYGSVALGSTGVAGSSEYKNAAFNNNFYLILNVAIGGSSFYNKIKNQKLLDVLKGSDYKEKMNVINFDNSTMQVDWVRIFSN